MNHDKYQRIIRRVFFAFGLTASALCSASGNHQDGSSYEEYQHYNGYDDYYNQGWSYGGGNFYLDPSSLSSPSPLFNSPTEQYFAGQDYPQECQHVETCNSHGNCWLEPICD